MVKFCSILRNVNFVECKMLGSDFSGIGQFSGSFSFGKTILSYASFYGVKLRNTIYDECQMDEVDFQNSDIASSEFRLCNLDRASFYETNLEKVDFSTSYNFSINPSQNKLKKAIFSERELKGLLAHLNIQIL